MEGFSWTTRVAAPVKSVAEFHARPGAIRTLTPFVIPMSRHRMEPLAEGSIAEFTLWFGPLPIRWTALHTEVDSKAGFTDTQISGPFKYWKHIHRYESDIQSGSRIVESINYEHAPGLRGLMTRILFSRPMLFVLFTYRSLIFKLSLSRTRAIAQIHSGEQQ